MDIENNAYLQMLSKTKSVVGIWAGLVKTNGYLNIKGHFLKWIPSSLDGLFHGTPP